MNPRLLAIGYWPPGQVHLEPVADGRQRIPAVESAIDLAWATALAKPGIHLFDGPMCRLETWAATESQLQLQISQTSYKIFLGTNMANPQFADTFGPDVLANPIGLSTPLFTADHRLLLGRRNAAVVYYPDRVHPFAGSLEPTDPDVFTAITRELREELAINPADLTHLACTGVAQDPSLRQPELIFTATTALTTTQIESRLNTTEHRALWSIPADADAILNAIRDDRSLTPVAIAALQLAGRHQFGQDWLTRASSHS